MEAYEINGNFHQDENTSYFWKEKMLMIFRINESSFAKEGLPYKASFCFKLPGYHVSKANYHFP